MNHAYNLLFIPQVKTDALGRLSCARKGIHCVCVSVCTCLCVHRVGTEYGMEGLQSLPLHIWSLWMVCLFLWEAGLGKHCLAQRHCCTVGSQSRPIPSQSHPQTWCINSIGEMTLLSETVWSSRHSGVSGYSADDQMWTFARAPQTSEVRSNLKFYTLPFNRCFIHLLVMPTLCSFCYLLLSDWELRLWTL